MFLDTCSQKFPKKYLHDNKKISIGLSMFTSKKSSKVVSWCKYFEDLLQLIVAKSKNSESIFNIKSILLVVMD